MRRLGGEHRDARMAAGLSLRDAATASGASKTQLWRFERGDTDRVAISELGAWFAVLGLDLSIRAYPVGDPIRDRAQLALLERFRRRLHPDLRWRTEVALPIDGDLRAWDGEVRGALPERWRARVEAETRIADAQALERRLALKLRDDPDGHVILLVADTRANRAVLAGLRDGISAMLPLGQRHVMAALAAGREPGGSGIVVM
jgi:transcriptional regulator with XRE-family HTH domain